MVKQVQLVMLIPVIQTISERCRFMSIVTFEAIVCGIVVLGCIISCLS